MQRHLRSSAASGVMEGIIQGLVSKGQQPPTVEQQAEAARLLAGAENVESAMLVAQQDEIVDLIAEHADVVSAFQQAETSDALAWLQSPESGAATLRFADFLKLHGHRSFREYGLPAIVNLRTATRQFTTGDRVCLDADRGVLTRIENQEPAL